jgi:hypothetical protein
MSANQNCSRFNDQNEPLNYISTWNNELVTDWLKDIHLPQYVEIFRNHKINGYDLCHITNHDLQTEFNIVNLHDRNLILKKIRENMLKQCKIINDLVKISLKYKERVVDIQFDNESSLTIANLLNYIRDVFGIQVFSN